MFMALALEASGLALPKFALKHLQAPVEEAFDRRAFVKASLAGTVLASTRPAFAASAIDGEYWDPQHPRGLRTVMVDGGTATIVGQDEPEAPQWKLAGDVAEDSTLLIDFQPKGGPKDLKGKFVNNMDNVGIVFPDGNRWVKVSPIAGLYSDPNHPEGYRVVTVYPVGFGSGYYMATCYGNDGPGTKPFKLTGKLAGLASGVKFDFSPKGGPTDLIATFDGSGLVFPDGNKWPKANVFGN